MLGRAYQLVTCLMLVAGLVAGTACAASAVPARRAVRAATTGPAGQAPALTTSLYERNASAKALYHQGKAAGKAGEQGVVILDFGRPAEVDDRAGTLPVRGRFVTFSSIAAAVESYAAAYFRYAPAETTLDVAIGTNNSCTTGTPCGTVVCGCSDEPADLYAWGQLLGETVDAVRAWVAELRVEDGFTDVVDVVGADDAEPAFDPGYWDTYDVLAGYASIVGPYGAAMIDYGSAEPNYWSEQQLLQVAFGFGTDVAMPEIYYPADAGEWATLLAYAKGRLGEVLDIQGVLADERGRAATASYGELLSAIRNVTSQRRIPWLSAIAG